MSIKPLGGIIPAISFRGSLSNINPQYHLVNQHLVQDTFTPSSGLSFKGGDDENFNKGVNVAKAVLPAAAIFGSALLLNGTLNRHSNQWRSDFNGHARDANGQLRESNRLLESINGKLGGGGP